MNTKRHPKGCLFYLFLVPNKVTIFRDNLMKKYSFHLVMGLLFLLCLSTSILLWLYAVSQTAHLPFQKSVEVYLNYYPQSLQNAFLLTVVNILFGFISLLFFSFGIKFAKTKTQEKGLILLIVCASMLTFWQVFTLL